MKKAIIILAIVTLVSIIYATTMTVHTSSGDVDFEISEITSITFESDGGGTGEFEWCTVPAGDYTYGDPPVTQNINYDFQIMKYEVTNQQYVDYLQEAYSLGDVWIEGGDVVGYYEGDDNYPGGVYDFYDLGTPLSSYNYARISWDGDSFIINVPSGYSPGDFDNHPVVEVSWFGSWAFAEHYGLRLPTEEEWEKAARGNTGYVYPWGNSLDGSRANYWDSGDSWDNGTTPVGMYNGQTIQGLTTTDSPSPYGAYDLAGNVWEWTDSWLSDSSSDRVRRGGSWGSSINALESWNRQSDLPILTSHTIGFRCVVQ
jgi:formylglycine-generating enzyme required for sulfatase activity